MKVRASVNRCVLATSCKYQNQQKNGCQEGLPVVHLIAVPVAYRCCHLSMHMGRRMCVYIKMKGRRNGMSRDGGVRGRGGEENGW
jgi:hypothetical protein